MAVCGTASKFAKLGLVIHFVGSALFFSGFGTNAWMAIQSTQTSTDIIVGLFKMVDCSGGPCNTMDITSEHKNGSRSATIALMSLATLGIALCLVMYSIYVALENTRSKCHAVIIICIEFLVALLVIIGMIIWLAQIPSEYFASYSLGLVVLGAAFFICAGFLLIADVRQRKANVALKRKTIRVTPPPNYDYSPPPKYISPSPQLHRTRQRQWDDRRFHVESSVDFSSPRESIWTPQTPRTPRTPRRVRVHVRSETPVSLPSTISTSNRRYGTPKYSQRYDPKAR